MRDSLRVQIRGEDRHLRQGPEILLNVMDKMVGAVGLVLTERFTED
jgi:hypothetical protein